ncbi:ABC transporter permease subunit [Dorea sp. D27]|uniref:ABC transporter permease subunit n=1 Tax=Dorea sp. D27 TaxID=658665 RepID=UPI000673C6F0|nr:ABC transporter permease subunit [Dorea sp. D27]KMZ55229.1 hypothetical protein HMPREF0980_00577 [Dorea sp. D27]
MINLLRNDFYKLGKAKYFWVCLIVAVVLAAASIFLLDFTYKIGGDQMAAQMEQQQKALDENGVNISTQGVPGSYDELNASGQMLSFFAGNTTLLLAVLVSLFVGSEFNNGTIKNIASRNYSRGRIYLSKLIVCVITGVVFTLLYAAVSTVTATALWGFGDVGAGFWPDFFKAAGIELLLGSAFVSVFVMFSMLIRQNGGSLAANICFLEFISLLVMLGEIIIKKLSGRTVTLSNYLIDTNMTAVSSGLTRTVAIRGITVALCFLAAAAIIGMVSFQKRDIK